MSVPPTEPAAAYVPSCLLHSHALHPTVALQMLSEGHTHTRHPDAYQRPEQN